MRETKEQLKIELETLKEKYKDCNEKYISKDLNNRKEFARAFGWNKPRKQYDYGNTELYEPTWTEIFVELGKLLNGVDVRNFEGNISELECRVEEIEKKLNTPKE